MSLGLKRGIVQLEPHDKQWDEIALQTIKTLKSILGDDAIDIQHIGSTAIQAIKAKPIIDIAVGVTDFDKVMLHNEQLRQVGIFYRGSDVESQLLYVMGDMEGDTRTHQIHVVKWNGTEWKNYIHFRDYLNANENVALQYQKLKEELESKYADDMGIPSVKRIFSRPEPFHVIVQGIIITFGNIIMIVVAWHVEHWHASIASLERLEVLCHGLPDAQIIVNDVSQPYAVHGHSAGYFFIRRFFNARNGLFQEPGDMEIGLALRVRQSKEGEFFLWRGHLFKTEIMPVQFLAFVSVCKKSRASVSILSYLELRRRHIRDDPAFRTGCHLVNAVFVCPGVGISV